MLDKLSATDIVLIITAIGLVLTNTISAWRTSSKVDVSNEKLDIIHTSTDGNLTKMQEKLSALEVKATAAETRAISLQDIVTTLTKNTVVVPTVISSVDVPTVDKIAHTSKAKK